MDPSHLEDDEFRIEFEVRGLSMSRLDDFYSTLKDEKAGLLPMPSEIHKSVKTITGEVAEISWKLHSMDLTSAARSGNPSLLAKCMSRLYHLQGRISRVLSRVGHNEKIEQVRSDVECSLKKVTELMSKPSGSKAVGDGKRLVKDSFENEAKELLEILHEDNKSRSLPSLPSTVEEDPTMITGNNVYRNQDRRPENRIFTPSQRNRGLSSLPATAVETIEIPHALNTHVPATVSTNPQEAFASRPFRSFSDQLPHPVVQGHPTGTAAQGWTMGKWPLRFSGGPNDLPVEEFIFRAETLARLANLTEQALTLGLHQLLSGSAASWYWVYIRNEPNASWLQVKRSLIEAFQSMVSDVAIRRKMMDRLQRPSERFIEFCTAIQELEVRLSNRMADFELLEVLQRNMLSHLQDRLLFVQVHSVRELQQSVRQIEELLQRQAEVHQIRRSTQAVHEMFLPSHNPSSTKPRNDSLVFTERNSELPQPSERNQQCSSNSIPVSSNPFAGPSNISFQNGSSEIVENDDQSHFVSELEDRNQFAICWNCDEMGHTFMDCSAPRLIFCFGCGTKNCVRPQCPKCNMRSLQGNGRRNVRQPGMQQVGQVPGDQTFRKPSSQFRQH